MWKYKTDFTLEERKSESDKITRFWPNKIPIIIEKKAKSQLEDVPKSKLLCPDAYDYSQFLFCLRTKIQLKKEDSLFVFIKGTEVVTGDKPMKAIYQENKDEDGFLYLMYCENEALGNY